MRVLRMTRWESYKGFHSKNQRQERLIAETTLQNCINALSLSESKVDYDQAQSNNLNQRLAQLEKENLRLKEIILDLHHENRALTWIIEKRYNTKNSKIGS